MSPLIGPFVNGIEALAAAYLGDRDGLEPVSRQELAATVPTGSRTASRNGSEPACRPRLES